MIAKENNIKKCSVCSRYHIRSHVQKKMPYHDAKRNNLLGYFFKCSCGQSLFLKDNKKGPGFPEPL